MDTQELLEKLKTAKSAEELIKLAKAEGVEIPADKTEGLFAQLTRGELSDDDLEKVSGGRTLLRLPPISKPF